MRKETSVFPQQGRQKKKNFDNLDLRNVPDNKNLWKIVKPLFADQGMNHDKLVLVENDEIISENQQISKSFNSFFADAIINLNIPQYKDSKYQCQYNTNGSDDPVSIAIEK